MYTWIHSIRVMLSETNTWKRKSHERAYELKYTYTIENNSGFHEWEIEKSKEVSITGGKPEIKTEWRYGK